MLYRRASELVQCALCPCASMCACACATTLSHALRGTWRGSLKLSVSPHRLREAWEAVRERRKALWLKRRSVLELRESGLSELETICDLGGDWRARWNRELRGDKGEINEPRLLLLLLLLAMRNLQTFVSKTSHVSINLKIRFKFGIFNRCESPWTIQPSEEIKRKQTNKEQILKEQHKGGLVGQLYVMWVSPICIVTAGWQ